MEETVTPNTSPTPTTPPVSTPASTASPQNPPIPQPPTPPKINKPLIIGAIIVTLLLLTTTGFLAYQNFKSSNKSINQTTPTPTASQTPTNDLANWKTYDKILGFSFRYPNDWEEKSTPTVQSNDGDISIWVQKTATTGLECLNKTTTRSVFVDKTNLELEYYDGVKNDLCDNQNKKLIFLTFKTGGEEYWFMFSYNKENRVNAEALFGQILSTFKFTQ